MKKLFLAICFIFLNSGLCEARVQEVLNAVNLPKPQQQTAPRDLTTKVLDAEEFTEFLTERLERTLIKDEASVYTNAVSVEPSEQAKMLQKESQKSGFEKIYDRAMQRISGQNENQQPRADITGNNWGIDDLNQQKQEWNQPDFPVIDIVLPPNNTKVMVPAREHIPYLMTNIDILPDGMVKFDETIMVIANSEKLKNGLTKVLPKYVVSRDKKKQKLDYSLLSVTVNGQVVPYKITEDNEKIYLVPEHDYKIEPGVYVYNFQYVNDQLLWDYKDFRELYWDITGSSWNLVIARAGATLTVPPSVKPLGLNILTGRPGNLRNDLVRILNPGKDTYGIVMQFPLYSGDGFHVIMSLPENAVTPPGWSKKLLTLFDKYGDVIISLLTLAAIAISFKISWNYIRRNKGQLKFNLKKSGALLRYLAFNCFDFLSFGSFLLELYRKNIIDIQQADDTILLIKRTDNLQSLSKGEQKAVNQIFTNHDAVFNANKANLLKIKRAANFLKEELNSRLRRYILKMNSGYLFFSIGMLLIGELFIALLEINSLYYWSFLALGSFIMLIGGRLIMNTADKLWPRITLRLIGGIITIISFFAMSALIKPLSVLFILICVATILRYTSIYTQRNGLLQHQIDEAKKLQNYLQEHKNDILLGRDIINYQANILALNLTEQFKSDDINEFNKLPIMEILLKRLCS